MKRYRLVQDDSCHWYMIPADQEKEFEAWVEYWASEDTDGVAEPLENYEKFRLGGSPSLITFTDPVEE